ncbi:MAG: hypothetical protein FWB83_02395 [Treponema sp.]|nr:hypothetical protein [Treponema sp.]
MATIKKTATKPAAKKPAAKKPAAKAAKPAAKKTAAKPAVKKAAAKPAAKKPAAKAAVKPAAKAAAKPAAKAAAKPAAKAAAKPAVKKAAAKPAAKPAAKTAVKAAVKPAVKKAAAPEADVKYRNLFDAYEKGKLPFAHGYIVSSFFSANSAYSIYEIVSYEGVKEIFLTATGLQFNTGGKKLYILVEPDTYHFKPVEPVSRSEGEKIPKRFNELETIIAKNQTRIMVAKEPTESYGAFTILKPQGMNFSIVFYEMPEVYDTLAVFFEESLNRQRKVPQSDAKKAAHEIASIVKKTMGFQGEFVSG